MIWPLGIKIYSQALNLTVDKYQGKNWKIVFRTPSGWCSNLIPHVHMYVCLYYYLLPLPLLPYASIEAERDHLI